MSQTLSVGEAKRNFSEIMRRAGAGERFTVTNHGRAIAQIGPLSASLHLERQEAIELMKKERKGRTLGGLSVKERVNEGRP